MLGMLLNNIEYRFIHPSGLLFQDWVHWLAENIRNTCWDGGASIHKVSDAIIANRILCHIFISYIFMCNSSDMILIVSLFVVISCHTFFKHKYYGSCLTSVIAAVEQVASFSLPVCYLKTTTVACLVSPYLGKPLMTSNTKPERTSKSLYTLFTVTQQCESLKQSVWTQSTKKTSLISALF